MECLDEDEPRSVGIKTRKRKGDGLQDSQPKPSRSQSAKYLPPRQSDGPILKKTRSAPAQVNLAAKPRPPTARGRKKPAAPSKPSIPEDRKCFRGKTFC